MKKKSLLFIALGALALLVLAGCAGKTPENAAGAASGPVYIVYTNDIHGYIYNTVTDEAGEEKPGLRLSNIKALVDDMRAEGKAVALVDAGDEIQGDTYAFFDEGKTVIDLMNEAGFQLATIGNHEFDYGMFTFFERAEQAEFPYVSCNFRSIESGGLVFDAYRVMEVGGVKVAFVGITTPETITSSAPVYFQNESGEYIYTFDGADGAQKLYDSVQNAVNEAKAEADYVIALGHTGIGRMEIQNGISSYDIIANVSGLDAYIDGHSHSLVEKEQVKDKDGKDVLLTQTGSYLSNVGVLTIDMGVIDTSLVSEYDRADEELAAREDAYNEQIMAEMGEKIGELSTGLYVKHPDAPETRLIRAQEMNIGDFTADAIYAYFNENLKLDCDLAVSNGGGIRDNLMPGDITYQDIRTVHPFGNMICLIEATGQEILDTLENGVNVVGQWDDEWNAPAENGGFMHVAGLKYTIDASIPSSLVSSEDGMFISVDGEYRVKDVMVYDRQEGEYKPLELEHTYTVGGINYLLNNGGNGLGFLMDNSLVVDYVGLDYVVLAEYIKSFKTEGEFAVVKTENSPLASYENYLIDYENPYGAGRITVITN